MTSGERVAARFAAKTLDLAHWDLEGMLEGKPVTLYHGTTSNFKTFDPSKSREELVDKYYGSGIFLTPSERVARTYAQANRNIGLPASIVDDLKSKNPNAGAFLAILVAQGADGWEAYWKANGFWNDNPAPGEGTLDSESFYRHVGVDPNTLGDIAGYIIGSKTKPIGLDDNGALDLFNTSTGAPDYLYDELDKVGLDSAKYRPKVYTVTVTVTNPLVTARKTQARGAKSKGYDSVIFYGSDLVQGVPEVAVFNPHNVHIRSVEVV